MIATIKNAELKVSVNSFGAQLWSIQDAGGKEYLWQGDARYWRDRALNLFPYIARMTQGKYTFRGKTYEMPIHGFVNRMELSVAEVSEERVAFELTDSPETLSRYPFHFRYQVAYGLAGNELSVTFLVENRDREPMYFGIGGHPGFFVPMQEGLSFEDYSLEFSEESQPVRIGFTPACFLSGDDRPYPLEGGNRIPLSHSLFDDDAIVLTGMAKSVTIRSDKGSRAVRVAYPQMDYLGLWHAPRTDAPYVCIEPWSSLPSRQDVVEDLSTQPGLVCLAAGERYANRWTITIF